MGLSPEADGSRPRRGLYLTSWNRPSLHSTQEIPNVHLKKNTLILQVGANHDACTPGRSSGFAGSTPASPGKYLCGPTAARESPHAWAPCWVVVGVLLLINRPSGRNLSSCLPLHPLLFHFKYIHSLFSLQTGEIQAVLKAFLVRQEISLILKVSRVVILFLLFPCIYTIIIK